MAVSLKLLLFDPILRKAKCVSMYFFQNSLDAGIQDRSTSISIMYKIEKMSHEEDDESDIRTVKPLLRAALE